ncbi:menaquinone biosynthesis family protein [Campylobacter pinnipediorum]|uniref:1,4-dihydroxy-6-naphtoate synthase n=1 Tax=Campylobacter pinnipediorum subsp. pinnipediorum TaxID=1660067 RepID=A0AAX0L8D9_9BACT|nr:MqnA/MqnD/SBP family protein [Campylobacter pinnipediorum]AQW80557.1 1,4-dihydroxy-6-naphthoate synthase [Campylobacter pinnipediorum subsp. pinnipediorum]AQW82226.1 1,4-dihydroxy-6-naphthoate synthase [Campylobacter pinnipediorum subsp. pinnipediorum]OPA74936.1 S-ribosylhomocysteine lyase [Campylobacter pinnipediorum subsp. pinnipediorum]OPA75036.1 S-ribosylhomocysteine lyase [Campylobacter pinnipediorum subsp. pinnipediorum]
MQNFKQIDVAHSPDADDIFMYMAIKFGWVSAKNLRFSNIALDIQTLNDEALKGTYTATAISFALYPLIKDDYSLLRTAVSFGNGYGPKLVKKKDTRLKRNFKVALSGQHTTNALLFKIAYPDARIVYKNFLDIEKAVVDGEVDAGVLIHESILEFSEELCVEREIWDIWCELAGEIPLPLGGMAIRRSLPLTDAIMTEEVLTKAVKIATSHKPFLSHMLMERDLIRVDKEKLKTYLNMYANDDSISMNDIALNSLDKLFEIGYKSGVYPELIKAADYLIPKEYNDLRFS